MGKKDQKKGKGAGRAVILLGVVVAAGIGATWFLAPDLVQEQLDALRGLFGG
jgi:hypothetical protein